ncbi:hypothetical protein T265_10591 [Opisthorchis viverrini]|uniref:Uncharacterized protein n=1 Tax=Opisthorchis viverrini TaxID=6198 RepID=A0A074ZCQ7_OPIVI|nr:hypothetical protein T265_10591 [Opisthorchis viverrini]KER20980.1 hypothetical protein T265_10591 [Opisthorchis viverrini]
MSNAPLQRIKRTPVEINAQLNSLTALTIAPGTMYNGENYARNLSMASEPWQNCGIKHPHIVRVFSRKSVLSSVKDKTKTLVTDEYESRQAL